MRLVLIIAAAAVIGIVVLGIGAIGTGLVLENQDSFCASCHTEPEVTYYQQSIQTAPVTLAAFHTGKQTTCIDCHSGGGVFGRATGLMQGTDDLVMYLGGNYARPAVTTNPLGDDSCVKCHEDVFQRGRGNRRTDGHYHAFLPRWQVADANAAHCFSCHTSHAQAAANQQFLEPARVNQTCDQCHAAIGERD